MRESDRKAWKVAECPDRAITPMLLIYNRSKGRGDPSVPSHRSQTGIEQLTE